MALVPGTVVVGHSNCTITLFYVAFHFTVCKNLSLSSTPSQKDCVISVL